MVAEADLAQLLRLPAHQNWLEHNPMLVADPLQRDPVRFQVCLEGIVH